MAKNLPWKEVAVFENDIQSLEIIKAMAEAALWNIKEINEHKRIVEQKTGASENTKVNKTRENVKTASAEKSESEENVNEENNTATRDSVIKFSLMNDTSFEDNIDNIIDMTDEDAIRNKEQGNFIRIMHNTPSIILDNIKESENNEVIIRFDALYLATRKDGVLDGHYHNLGKEVMKNLPHYLSVPDAIVRMNNGRINIFATIETEKGKNGIISMELNTVKDINAKNKKYNLVVTVFSAKDNYIKNNLKKFGAEVVYKKEDLSQVNHQLYEWLATINDKSSDNSISQDDTPVNTNYVQKDKDDTNKFSYAGGKAKTANFIRLDEAIRLESEGLSLEEIRQQTGWFRGYDNIWRFEIDDSKMEFSRKGFFTNPDVLRYHELADKFLYGEITDEENRELQALKKSLEGVKLRPETLGDYVKHDELFKAYPELKNLKVTFRSDMPTEDHGSYNPLKKEIVLNSFRAQDEDAFRHTLIHEIQHAVQDIEGFAGGADTYNPDYGRTAGEIEARDVSKRLGYDAEKRKNTRPDIDRTDVVFSDANVSFSSHDVENYTKKEYNKRGKKVLNTTKMNQTSCNG